MKSLLLLGLAFVSLAAAAQTYDPQTRMLALPAVTVSGQQYGDVEVEIIAFELLGVGGVPVSSTTYDPATQALSLPSITIAGTGELFNDVRVKLTDMVVKTAKAPSRLYVNLVSHNEDTATGGNADCQAFFSDADSLYEQNSAALEAVARTVNDRGASFDFQSDVEYLNLVLSKETAQDNVLRRLASAYPDSVALDAHAHESFGKNYADVANLLESVAGVRNGVVGGFTAVACRPNAAAPDWDKFRAPLSPASGFGAAFNATVLTLGSSAGHVCDPDASGIWRPAATGDFFSDDPARTLMTIGTGYAAKGLVEAATAIGRLVSDYKTGKLPPNRMYTASITIGHCNMHLPDSGETAEDVATFIDAVNAMDDATDFIRWATFPRMVDIWNSEYAGSPGIWQAQ